MALPDSEKRGWHLSRMFEEMEHGKLRALHVIGENPAQSEADQVRALRLLTGLEHLVVQDIFLTRTGELAHVVLPASASWCEDEGTVTSSERRVQRVRKALEPPGQARSDLWILSELGKRLDVDLGVPAAEKVWNELAPSPLARGYWARGATASVALPRAGPSREPFHGRLWNESRVATSRSSWPSSTKARSTG
jgi:formate dehydrogenase major subunit